MAEATVKVILLTICVAMLSPTGANAAGTASIAGTVTAPVGAEIAVTICAIASGGEERCAATLATNVYGNSPGAYTITGLVGGEYRVSFAARCSVEPCPSTFPPEYYDNQTSLANATPIQLSATETLAGVDAKIEYASERLVREYREDQEPAKPTGERSLALPGAIEPLPVNKQVEEEFWAHPPWDNGTTPSARGTTPSAGVAAVADTATVKGASAELTLQCTGAGACSGLVVLVDRVTERHLVKRGEKRVSVKQPRNILVGPAGFSFPSGASEKLLVPLTRGGQILMRRAGKKALKVKLTGSGVRSGALVLKK
jgi:hypothetical protein